MTEHDPIGQDHIGQDQGGRDPLERALRASLAAGPAPQSLQRRIAQIPLEHLRPAGGAAAARQSRGPWLSTWFAGATASWGAGFAAAAASLAIGFWLGFAGLAVTDVADTQDELATLVFSGVPAIGDEL